VAQIERWSITFASSHSERIGGSLSHCASTIDNFIPACRSRNAAKHMLTEAKFRLRIAREQPDAPIQ